MKAAILNCFLLDVGENLANYKYASWKFIRFHGDNFDLK